MQLGDSERILVEENMALVGKVIKDNVKKPWSIGIFGYEDLFQIGCVGLCKAAKTSKPGNTRFSTYAYILIRNEIFDALAYSTFRSSRETSEESERLSTMCTEYIDTASAYSGLDTALNKAMSAATGVTAKGIEAIRLLSLGYKCREIGELMGASANNVSAWISKARKYLQMNPAIAAYREAI